jgi:hypothetical protein
VATSQALWLNSCQFATQFGRRLFVCPGYSLTAVYAGPSSYDEWGPNILDRQARQGDSVSVTIGLRDAQECRYDFRYEFSDGDAYEEYAVNVCDIDGDEFIIE